MRVQLPQLLQHQSHLCAGRLFKIDNLLEGIASATRYQTVSGNASGNSHERTQGSRNSLITSPKNNKQLTRRDIREFLDWVHEQAVAENGANPGRTANKARENLRAVLSWAWEQDLLETLPRFPPPREQRDVAGRHYLTKAEINALYFATYQLKRPRGWADIFSIGRYWRSALALCFNYGLDSKHNRNRFSHARF